VEIERFIIERGHPEEIRKTAVAPNMLPLRQAGLAQARCGLTTSTRSCGSSVRVPGIGPEPVIMSRDVLNR
jgi:hypothetical protein